EREARLLRSGRARSAKRGYSDPGERGARSEATPIRASERGARSEATPIRASERGARSEATPIRASEARGDHAISRLLQRRSQRAHRIDVDRDAQIPRGLDRMGGAPGDLAQAFAIGAAQQQLPARATAQAREWCGRGSQDGRTNRF